jgi:hypothetical protein
MAENEDEKAKPRIFKIELKVDEKLAGGEYANICVVNHSDSEFVLDSFFLQPGRPQASMKGRVILSPKNAKRLLLTLQDQIARFEKRFGEIDAGPATPSVKVIH